MMGQWIMMGQSVMMGQWVNGSWVTMGQWVMGHVYDGSDGSWVTKKVHSDIQYTPLNRVTSGPGHFDPIKRNKG